MLRLRPCVNSLSFLRSAEDNVMYRVRFSGLIYLLYHLFLIVRYVGCMPACGGILLGAKQYDG